MAINVPGDPDECLGGGLCPYITNVVQLAYIFNFLKQSHSWKDGRNSRKAGSLLSDSKVKDKVWKISVFHGQIDEAAQSSITDIQDRNWSGRLRFPTLV